MGIEVVLRVQGNVFKSFFMCLFIVFSYEVGGFVDVLFDFFFIFQIMQFGVDGINDYMLIFGEVFQRFKIVSMFGVVFEVESVDFEIGE